jgi:putative tryptophan/tyrosine transport system substrate-binding protein
MRRREFIAGLGGAVAWPLAARAQQRALPVIGWLEFGYAANLSAADIGYAANLSAADIDAFWQAIGEHGYVEGRNVEILYRSAEGQFERLPELAADLVRRRVAVIVAGGTWAALAAKKATATIPIVFWVGSDPVQAGLVASLNRPGSNVTGTTYLQTELAAKRLELLHEMAPAAKSIGYLHYNPNPSIPAVNELSITALETAAGILAVRLVTAKATTASEIEEAFAMLVGEGVGALIVGGDLVYWANQIIPLAAHYALPAIYDFREMVEAGGLISYEGDFRDALRVASTYVGRILKGEKPTGLPVQQSTRIKVVINLRTAKALGLTIPETLLAIADQVIE